MDRNLCERLGELLYELDGVYDELRTRPHTAPPSVHAELEEVRATLRRSLWRHTPPHLRHAIPRGNP